MYLRFQQFLGLSKSFQVRSITLQYLRNLGGGGGDDGGLFELTPVPLIFP